MTYYDTHIISHIFLIFYSLWIYKNNSRYDRYPFVPKSYHIYFSYFTHYGSIKTIACMIDIRLSETQRQENQCSSAKSSQPTVRYKKYIHTVRTCYSLVLPLQWHQNERDGVSNHRRLECLLSNLFKRRSKKTSKFTGLSEGNPPVTGGFSSQRLVMRKMFPFDDVIMTHIHKDSYTGTVPATMEPP